MNDAHVQVYGWVAPGGNLSTNSQARRQRPRRV